MGGREPGCWACGTLGKSLPTSGPCPPAAKRAGWVNMTRPMVLCPFEEQPAPRGMGFTPSYVLPEPWGAGLCSSLFSLNPANICVFFFFFFLVTIEPPPHCFRLFGKPCPWAKVQEASPDLGQGPRWEKRGRRTAPQKKTGEKVSKGCLALCGISVVQRV